jgi:hypothetical protein
MEILTLITTNFIEVMKFNSAEMQRLEIHLYQPRNLVVLTH